MKILIIGPSWVGDMVMAQSLFKTLSAQYKKPQIDVLAPAWSQEILELMPEVNQTIDMPIGHGELKFLHRKKIANTLKSQSYDWAIVLPNSFKSALIPFFAKIPKRTGWRGEYRYGLLNDIRKLNKEQYPMMVQRYVALAYPEGYVPEADNCPAPQLSLPENILKQSLHHFNIIKNQNILALCPGAEFGATKKWPEKYYQQVARWYIQNGGEVWLFGSKNDQTICNTIARSLDNAQLINFAGKTTLQQAVMLLSQVNDVVANDSGLMHVAAALGKRVIVIYGGTSEKFTPPLSSSSKAISTDISCRPCQKRVCPYGHYRCLEEIKPEVIMDALCS